MKQISVFQSCFIPILLCSSCSSSVECKSLALKIFLLLFSFSSRRKHCNRGPAASLICAARIFSCSCILVLPLCALRFRLRPWISTCKDLISAPQFSLHTLGQEIFFFALIFLRWFSFGASHLVLSPPPAIGFYCLDLSPRSCFLS
jgi:hypothetical protein